MFLVSLFLFILHYRSTEAKKEKVRGRSVIFSGGDHIPFEKHPFTCDCSGGEKCERFNKTGEGEMSAKDGWFQCPCGNFKQHKL